MVFKSVRNSLSDSVATWAGKCTLNREDGPGGAAPHGYLAREQERYRSAEVGNAQALVAAVSAAEP